MTKWSVQVSDETDKAVKAFLADQGMETGDISAFVEKAVKTVLRREREQELDDVAEALRPAVEDYIVVTSFFPPGFPRG